MVMRITLLLFCILFVGCLSRGEDEVSYDFGLQSYSLQVSEENYNNLFKTSFVNEWMLGQFEGCDEFCIKIRRQGKSSRKYPKPSFKVVGEEAEVFSAQYYDKSFCRYFLADYLFEKAGFDMPDLEPVVLFINHRFLGLYLKRECIDEDFFEKRSIEISSLYKVGYGVEFSFKTGMVVHSGFEKKIPQNDLCFTDLEKLITNLDKWHIETNRKAALEMLDVKNILDYYAISVLLRNYDCITYNYYFAMNRDIKKFQFIPWDLDRTYEGEGNGLPQYTNGLFERLLTIEEYANYVERRQKELFNPKELKSVLAAHQSSIDKAYREDPYLSLEEISQHNNELHTYIDSIFAYIHR